MTRARSVRHGVAGLTLLVALVASLAVAATVRSQEGGVRSDGPPPSCGFGDVLTPHRGADDDLRSMHRAAVDAGAEFGIASAYRSYDRQVRTFDSLEQAYGHDSALES